MNIFLLTRRALIAALSSTAITSCVALQDEVNATYNSIQTGIRTSVTGVVDGRFEQYKVEYKGALQTPESSSFRLESDMKMGLPHVELLPGVYTKTEFRDGVDGEGRLIAVETMTLGEDREYAYSLLIYREEGASIKWTASGEWESIGETLFIRNPRGDTRVLAFDAAARGFSRCIVTEQADHHVKLGCDGRDYVEGGSYYAYRKFK